MSQLFRRCCFFLILFTSAAIFAETNKPIEPTWPQIYETQDAEITVYQPQIEKMDKNDLTFRVAIAAKPKGSDEIEYGALKGRCKLDVDKEEGIATCSNIQLDEVNFPGDEENEEAFKEMVNEEIADQTVQVSTDHLAASLKLAEISKERQSHTFSFDPPEIIVTKKPTALITIDGKPVLRPVNDELMRVINTPFVILFDQESGDYYLRSGKSWHTASDLSGPWLKTKKVPKAVKELEEPAKAQGESKEVDDIIVSFEPAELIQIKGQPEFTPIKGTDLLYVYNTENDVFLQVKTQRYYLLLSGRWYTSKNLESQSRWRHVAPKELPETFKKIPEDSDKSHVLANVPDTVDAEEALIRNQIPTTAAIDKKNVSTKVEYDGEPQFKGIRGTSLDYVENASKPVLRYKDDFYSNEEGVWFISQSPHGPWRVAESIPEEIYDIPPNHPLYYLTYNYVYDTDDDYVYVGYTPGYEGSYSYDGSVIFGTGYDYPGWAGDVYYGYPHTYGYSYVYDPYYGWYADTYYANPFWFGVGLTIGLASRYYWYNDWHRYYYKRDYHKRKRDRYNRWDKKHVKKRHPKRREWGDHKYRAKHDDRQRDRRGDRDRAERGDRRGDRDRAEKQRDRRGDRDRTERGDRRGDRERAERQRRDRQQRERAERQRRDRQQPQRTERQRRDRQQPQRTERQRRDRQQPQRTERQRRDRQQSQRTERQRRNDVYSGRDGSVYRKRGDNWERRTREGWNRGVSPDRRRSLDQQRRARQRGDQMRSRSRSMERSSGRRRGGGSGGRRGGGRGRR